MSSILKALQKLEQEKNSRVTREPDIHAGVTKKRRSQSVRPNWILPVSLLAVALISVTVTYLLMKSANRSLPTAQTAAPPSVDTSRSQNPHYRNDLPEATLPVSGNPLTPPIQTIGSSPSPTTYPPAGPPKPSRMPITVAPPSARATKSLEHPASSPSKPAAPPKVQQPGEKQPQAPPQPSPSLSVNGIAWQKDSASRIAVVNGMPVSEGSSIQGARVDEIFPDKVRFSHQGKSFDIPFGRDDQH